MDDKCGGCHLCCTYFLINLTDVPEDALTFYKTWGIEYDQDENNTLLKIISPCRHLTETGCGIYKDRPLYCREFRCERNNDLAD